ncbi:stereocilin-like [Lissotriton helveticus]
MAAITQSRDMLDAKIGAMGADVTLLRQDLRNAVERITETESRISVVEDEVGSLKRKMTAMAHVQKALATRVEDAEGRARRNNLRFVGFPERCEKDNMERFLTGWLESWLPEGALSTCFVIERAHRALTQRPPEGERPRAVIARLLNYHDRDVILRETKLLYREAVKSRMRDKMQQASFQSLGTVAAGSDCSSLRTMLTNESIEQTLTFFRNLPVELDTYLKTCIVEELNNFILTPNLLENIGAQIAVQVPISIIKRLPVDSMLALKKQLLLQPMYLMKLPANQRLLLVDRMIQRLGMYSGPLSAKDLSDLGFLTTFVNGELFTSTSRVVLKQNLESMKAFCFDGEKQALLAAMLQEKAMFGSVGSWTASVLDQVDRFLFFLPMDALKDLSKTLITQQRLDLVFGSEKQWAQTSFGALCQQNVGQASEDAQLQSKQFLVQYSIGLLGNRMKPKAGLTPTCAAVKSTVPSAWPPDILAGMPTDEFKNCLEALGQDEHFTPSDLSLLLARVRLIFGAAATMPPIVVAQLGRIASQFSDQDLRKLNLSDLQAVQSLSKVPDWTLNQLSLLFTSFLNASRLSVSDLDSVKLVALGGIVCGIKTSDMARLSSQEFCINYWIKIGCNDIVYVSHQFYTKV